MTNTELVKTLQAVKKLISNPEKWNQSGYFVRKERQRQCFDLAGAIYRVMGALIIFPPDEDRDDEEDQNYEISHGPVLTRANRVLAFVATCLDPINGKAVNLVEFNDYHTHAEVLTLLDCAIDRAANLTVEAVTV
jgi:hypothetical protein